MAYLPYAPQKGAIYSLTGPAPQSVVAVFNDPTDPNYVGMLSDITGLDSPDVRESADDLAAADGGVHGDFYFGRRPIVLTVEVFGHATAAERDARIDRAMRASKALRGDSILSWINSPAASNVQMQTWVRRQQPVRAVGGWTKQIQIPLVSQYAQLVSTALHTASGAGTVTVENIGSDYSFPILRVAGAAVNPTITVGSTVLRTTGLTINVGQYVDFDTANHTATWQDGTSANRYIDWAGTSWPVLAPAGLTDFQLSAGTLTVTWRDAWT